MEHSTPGEVSTTGDSGHCASWKFRMFVAARSMACFSSPDICPAARSISLVETSRFSGKKPSNCRVYSFTASSPFFFTLRRILSTVDSWVEESISGRCSSRFRLFLSGYFTICMSMMC